MKYCTYQTSFINLDERNQGMPDRPAGVLYTPQQGSGTAILLIHSDADYSGFVPAQALAERGFTVLAARVRDPRETLDQKIKEVAGAVSFLREKQGIRKVVLLGHSGGATLMSAYQAVAENGERIFQDDHKIIRISEMEALPPADAMMLLDSNWGNGVMTLISLEPGILREGSARELKKEFDLYDPANGYDPAGACYSREFIRDYNAAQEERNDRLIRHALSRLSTIEAGQGDFEDDEPFIVAGGSQIAPNNRLIQQDMRLLSRTKGAWPLLHGDGRISEEVIHSLRHPRFTRSMVHSCAESTFVTTVRSFLSGNAVRSQRLRIGESEISGIDWDSCYCCTPGNVRAIRAPMLMMGMTGSYEFLASELIYEMAGCEDKTIAFVEGASHLFFPEKASECFAGQFGDTVKTCFDYAAQWLRSRDF